MYYATYSWLGKREDERHNNARITLELIKIYNLARRQQPSVTLASRF